MGCRGRPFIDLNEPPAEEDEESGGVLCFQPQNALPSSNTHTSDMLTTSEGSLRILNNHAFSHVSSVSGFRPFVRPKDVHSSEECVKQKMADASNTKDASSSKTGYYEETRATPLLGLGPADAQAVEREEGEWSDVEGSAEALVSSTSCCRHEGSMTSNGKSAQEQGMAERTDLSAHGKTAGKMSRDVRLPEGTKDEVTDITKDENSSQASSGLDPEPSDRTHNSNGNSDGNAKGDIPMDGQEEFLSLVNQREVKGVEANHVLKSANNPGKKHKLDQHKEAMLGKKRSRQTMFLNLEDVKQAGPIKTSTPRRQTFSSHITTRTVKEIRTVPAPAERSGEKQVPPITKDQKQADISCNEGGTPMEYGDHKCESNGDLNPGIQTRSRRLNGGSDLSVELYPPPIPRQGSWKQPTDSRQPKNPQVSTRKPAVVSQSSVDPKLGNKKHVSVKKQAANSTQYQDTSVERLLREVTNEKFWHHPEETDLQCVPGRFESVEEYVKVFEPLLFEECRAQLYNTWEEFTETVSRDAHVMVRIKSIERRERGT
ncbi:hypothetical protein HHK36_009446 [Tetracentron sinense]|uniref:Uncharacterized protein n=1 Tax=Tetracentron sinense TaxID=13715 RepID=A0A834ZAX1_TETSI|nr:hypothetical protein HHK36_009446 [Tetracentron sinense]